MSESSFPALPPLPPHTDIARLRAANAAAARYRAEWMMSLHDGICTPVDLIQDACTLPGRPLRRLNLLQVVAAPPDSSMAGARSRLSAMARRLEQPGLDARKLTVGWLVDARSKGHRFVAYLDAVETDRDSPPWAGFPFAPRSFGKVRKVAPWIGGSVRHTTVNSVWVARQRDQHGGSSHERRG